VAPRANAEPDTGQTIAAGDPSPPDPATVYRMVGELVRRLAPTARNLRIVYDVPGAGGVSTGRIPITAISDASDLDGLVVGVLAAHSGWMKGRAVAAQLDLDPDGGHFRSTMARLAATGLIESNKALGYRLPSS
jgi:hypothetical protein